MADQRPYFDLIVIIPLREELEAFLSEFFPLKSYMTETQFRYSVDTGVSVLSMLVIQQEGMGRRHAYLASENALRDFDAGILAVLGIAGSISNDLRLADVVYADSVFDVYENAKFTSPKKGRMKVSFSPEIYSCSNRIVSALSFSSLVPGLKSLYNAWQMQRSASAQLLLPNAVVGRSTSEMIREPRAICGSVACASVTDSPEYNDALRGLDRKILAVETEAGGVFDVAQRHNVPALEIRSISDYADSNKGALESSSRGAVRKLAASNAVTFLKLQLTNPFLLRFLEERRSQVTHSEALFHDKSTTAAPPAFRIVEQLSTIIDSQLRELSPQYRLQIRGYSLPIPRLKAVSQGSSEPPRPVELTAALEAHRCIFVSVPANYPDRSLPWVIADYLLKQEINGKQCLPVLIDGQQFIPSKSNLIKSSTYKIDGIESVDDCTRVYVLDTLPMHSKAKIEAIASAMDREDDARFVIVGRTSVQLANQTETLRRLRAEQFDVDATSFIELSHFIQKNFSMSTVEAEAVALRLDSIFKRFRLSAHPTYFAGIQKESLFALLQASRRAELIQLAVDGYLQTIVESDADDIPLGRRARLRFLSELAISINVNGSKFDVGSIHTFTSEFLKRNDFDFEPVDFLSSFLKRGIISSHAEMYSFSLPFIEAYVLALGLSSRPDEALAYFKNWTESEVRRLTFDLYSELGAADIVIDDVSECIALSVEALALAEGQAHVLLTDEVKPALVTKPDRLKALQKRLNTLLDTVHTGTGMGASKQKDLDLLEEVKGMVAEKSAAGQDNKFSAPVSVHIKDLNFSFQSWHRGTVLLGSGAEHLSGSVKQNIACALVKLGSLLVHHWTKLMLQIDLQSIKDELTGQINQNSLTDEPFDSANLQEWMNGVVDLIEYTICGLHFHQITSHLCEQARLSVLSSSVERIRLNTPFEELLRAVWLSDIDSKAGINRLHSAIVDLAPIVFLRTALATHFLIRVHWNHGRKVDRLNLLEAADQALKPLRGQGIDKGALLREIKKRSDDQGEQ